MSTLTSIERLRAADTGAFLTKTALYSTFLFINFMLSFRVLLVSFVSAIELILEAAYIVCIGVYLVYRVITRFITKNLRFNSLELYLALIFFLPFWAANGARLEFGQPMFYGVATFRDFYLIFGGLIVYNMLRNKQISIVLVEKMFVTTAWVCVVFFYLSSTFTNPADFKDTALAGSNTAKGGSAYYRFNMTFIFFGSIYYFVKAYYHKRFVYVIYALIFLLYIVFLRFDRTSIAVSVAALGVFYLTALTPRKQVFWFLAGTSPLLFTAGLILFFYPEFYAKYYFMFSDAFLTLLGSTNAYGEISIRLYELQMALLGIEENPLIGNGKVSPRWVDGGYSYFLGYFYPSDVGIYGQIYMYGFIGAFILYFQFILAAIYALRIKHIKRNVFLITLKHFLIALALDSVTNGYLTIYAAQSMTGLILIYYFYQQDKVKGAELRMAKASRVGAEIEAFEAKPKALPL